MPDKRHYAVNYDMTSTVKSSVEIDLDEVREWMRDSGNTGEPDERTLVEFLLSSREDPWDDLNYSAYDTEDDVDYRNLRIVRETT